MSFLPPVNNSVFSSSRQQPETEYVIDGGERIPVGDAVFIFVSDFGRAGLSHNMTLTEVGGARRTFMSVCVFAWRG